MDFFSVNPPVFISDLLAGEKKKACDVIFLNSSHYLDSELSPLLLCSALSDCAQKFLDAACGNWFARHRMHDEKNLDRERKRNLWQLTSPLYTDYLKSFDIYSIKTLLE